MKKPRLTIIVQRDGKAKGLSMLAESPQKFNTFNPYNVFFSPTREQMVTVSEYMKWAKEITNRDHDWPEHIILLALMVENGNDTISFPECASLPGVQSAFIAFVVKVLLSDKERNITILTLSEYMIRALQVLTAKKVIPIDFVEIYDQENEFTQTKDYSMSSDLKDVHDYQGTTGNVQVI